MCVVCVCVCMCDLIRRSARVKVCPCTCILYSGIFYFTLGNVSPKFRSKLSSIQLVAIALHSDLSTYGMDAVLKPFTEDVMKLVSNVC